MTILEHLTAKIRSVAAFNSAVQTEPECILWPDPDKQWLGIIPDLLAHIPELLLFGDYDPEKRTGPAIWLRCAIAGEIDIPAGAKPIIYMPGIGRQLLRDVRNCPARLQPLVELQYRGTVWSQINSKDWTILAFLKSDQGGLGLNVAQDNETKTAIQLSLRHLLGEDLDVLKGKHLGKDFFNTLLTGDAVRELLSWLDRGEAFREDKDESAWKAFVSVCKSNYAFDPQKEGVLAGAAKLANREGAWGAIWQRYCESPKRYPNIPAQIRKCNPPAFDLFADSVSAGGWPQWNETQEHTLASDLNSLGNLPEHDARKKIELLEKQHSPRRGLVWAELGLAPLACALEHLARLTSATENKLTAGSIDDLAAGYRTTGWQADNAVIQALALVEKVSDLDPISSAVNAIYRPWAENAARFLQRTVSDSSYPGTKGAISSSPSPHNGECILFVDGLRFDVAKRLAELCRTGSCDVSERSVWTALPSVTATGKPAVSPVGYKISGADNAIDFEPCVVNSGQSLKGGYHFKKLLNEAGWTILDSSDNGDGSGFSWCEFGDIDHEGHSRGWKLARHISVLLDEIRDRIDGLLSAGWTSVRVVTDHGWLLLPGGLPKIDLPSVLAESKWGRCAAIKAGASTQERLYDWFWNPSEHFALADGISCYKLGEVYAHGGLSLQECLTLELTVTRSKNALSGTGTKPFDVVWRGLRCTIKIDSSVAGMSLDIREEAGNPLTTLVSETKPVGPDGTASVVVEDEDLQGKAATIVLLDEHGSLIAQSVTTIGGDE